VNFLSLCQRLRQEAGLSGSGPTSVLSQAGEMKRVVDWVSSAYEDIQNLHATWRFLRNDFSFSTIASTQDYTPAAVSLTEHASWVKNDIRLYSAVNDEDFLEYYPWEIFRQAYLFGSHRTLTGRPQVVTVKPNNALCFWPIPDAVYTTTGEYYKTAQIMTANASTPVIPSRFQMIIVWKALTHYGAYAGADEKYAHGTNEYKKLLSMLEYDQLEDTTFGEPLA
jgi:hypothetical protein